MGLAGGLGEGIGNSNGGCQSSICDLLVAQGTFIEADRFDALEEDG
jgi:hypothetical protein